MELSVLRREQLLAQFSECLDTIEKLCCERNKNAVNIKMACELGEYKASDTYLGRKVNLHSEPLIVFDCVRFQFDG